MTLADLRRGLLSFYSAVRILEYITAPYVHREIVPNHTTLPCIPPFHESL